MNVTTAVPLERVVDGEAETLGVPRAEYVRHLIRQAEDSPFDQPGSRLGETEDPKGAA